MNKYSVLFVCLGNICRSPLAEGVFRHLVIEAGIEKSFKIDSCGTCSYHVGSPAHPESVRVAKSHGISIDKHVARQVEPQDFLNFDFIVAMDRSNLRDLKNIKNNSRSSLFCLRTYDPIKGDMDVPDPYYGGLDGFELVFEIVYRCCENLLRDVALR